MGIKELWKKRDKSEGVWEGAETLMLGGLMTGTVPALPLRCPPAPPVPSCHLPLWARAMVGLRPPLGCGSLPPTTSLSGFCPAFQNNNVPGLAVPLPEDGGLQGTGGLQAGAWGGSVRREHGQVLPSLG